jgi:hypothetical protein
MVPLVDYGPLYKTLPNRQVSTNMLHMYLPSNGTIKHFKKHD